MLSGLHLLLFFLGTQGLAAPKAPCESFGPGEKTVFALTYLGATAGTTEIAVDASTANHWNFSARASSNSIFSLLYHLENNYASRTEAKKFEPEEFRATLDESRQSGSTTQIFEQKKRRVRLVDNRSHVKKGEIRADAFHSIPRGTQDVLSALFYVRRKKLELGTVVDLPVFIGEEVAALRLRVEAEETLPTKIGEIDAWVLKVSVMKEGTPSEIPDTYLWLEKAGAHAILKIKAKVKVGSFIAYLKSYSPGSPAPACRTLP